MAEIWLSREQVQRLLPVICRIGALLRDDWGGMTGAGFG